MERFTKELCELYVQQNLSLVESLRIMSHKPKGKIQKASEYLYGSLEKGVAFSSALRTCPYINFDGVYVTFVLLAENIGNIKIVIQYLNKKCERYRENKLKLISAFVYPVFVIFLSCFVCLFLSSFMQIENKGEIYKAFLLMVAISTLLIFVIWKTLGINKTYEAFLGTDLLVKGGVPLSVATSCGAMIAGLDTKVGKAFIGAGEKLEYGMDLRSAFGMNNSLEDAFYYADVSGCESDVFEKIAAWFSEKDERRRSLCLQLIEPVFVAITGTFLIALIINFFLPVLNNTCWF